MLMFEPHYTSRLIEIGDNDVASRLEELRTFLGQPSVPAISAVQSSRANAGGCSLL